MSDIYRSLADGFAFEDWDRSGRLWVEEDSLGSRDASASYFADTPLATATVAGASTGEEALSDGFDFTGFGDGSAFSLAAPAFGGGTQLQPSSAEPAQVTKPQFNGTYHSLASGNFSQDWSDAALITANDDWSGVSSIIGYLGDTNGGTPTGVDPQTLTANDASAVDVIANQTAPNTNTSGGVAEFTGANVGNNNTIALQGSGTADSPYLVIHLDSTGRENIVFTANIRDIDGSADNSVQQVAVQYRTSPTGTWINLPAGYIADATTGPSIATLVTALNVTLPAGANNQANLQIRIMTTNAAGNDEWVGIDDIVVTSSPAGASPGSLAINDVTQNEGDAGTTNYTFTVTRSGGTTGAVSATWTLADGTSDSADFTTTPQTGTVSFADGETSQTITITVAGDTTFEGNDTFFVNLTAPTGGATITDAQGLGTITNDDASPVAQLAIGDRTLAEGNSGNTAFTFTVTRSGDTAIAASATWTVSNGTTDAADFSGALTGTVSFAAGETTQTITVNVVGDTAVETNETFSVVLSNPSVNTVFTDDTGAGTITNDDAGPIANVWINEFNYDPAGTDSNEFIEVAGLAGTDLTGWTLVLYNGNGGASYSTLNLSGTLANTSNGFGFLKVLAPGLQNGAPDGFALVDNLGRVVQFLSYEGTMTATNGPANGLTSTDVGVSQDNAALGFTLQLVGTGSSYADFTWAANVANTEAAVNGGQTFLNGTDQGQIRIGDAQVTEGNSGTANLTFTVSRAGGFATSATVDYQVQLTGSADAADLGGAAVLSGTITFAAGEFTRTITIPVQGDTTGEGNETLFVQLSNVTGNAAIADGTATGTIINDDPVTLTIMQIQGAGHTSAYVGQPVTTTGIVTAVATNGYYLQDPSGDGNAATSDAMFVFTSTAPTVAVGDGVTVTGSVAEFAASGGLSVTQLNPTSVTINSSGNALPTAVLIGTGGLLPPSRVIDNDSLGTFDPTIDGIDFWEALEGMRVTLDAPRAVSNTNSFGETDLIVSGGTGATGANLRGGITVNDLGGVGDFNPEKIQIDDTFGALIGYTPNHTIGDVLASVTGVVNYSFLNYEVLATSAVTVTQDNTLTEEQTALQGDVNYLTIATYNLENMDPSDNKYTILGHDIVFNLRAPTILAVQEVQDADGAGTGSDLSGVSNVQGLINAIFAESGITYTYVEIAPTVANSTGGEPNGNIRNGYLYRADQVSLVSGSLALLTDAAYNGSRKPLVATWLFQGTEVTTINVHFTSRGGSDALWGATQPPSNAGDAARTAQAAAVGAYVNNELATDPTGQYMVLGDWNGFYFETAQTQLTDSGLFTNLAVQLLDPGERYSYIFEGNSQLLDNILATAGLLAGAQYDAVHLNAEFAATATRATDHDPQIARLLLGPAPTNVTLSNATVNENLPIGTVIGTIGAIDPGDTLTYLEIAESGGAFAVDPVTGVVTTTSVFDFETASGYSLTVQVTDSAGQSTTRNFTITVTDANDAPSGVADNSAVNEDATSANLWSALLANDTDPDSGAVLTISAVNTSGTLGTVVFDAGTQTLQYVANNNAFDTLAPGATLTDTFSYTVSDGLGGTSTATVTMTITGLADGTSVTATSTVGEYVFGTTGEDELFGGDGTDLLKGREGHDWLQAGGNDDKLQGGAGRDTFVFGLDDGLDVVRDFSAADDRIVLLEGGTVTGTSTLDYNSDGFTDLQINFSHNSSVILLGISSLAGIRIDENSTEGPPSTHGGWDDWSLPDAEPIDPAKSSLAADQAMLDPSFGGPIDHPQIDYIHLV